MAVVAVPLMGAVGMTVDYSRVNGARAAFQVALDSAALMMSKDAPTKTNPERQTEAAKTFSALFNRPEVTDATVTPVFHRGRRVETTLVLDDTGSMANDGEMDAFKTASHNLQSGRSERTGYHCRCAGSDHAALFFALCSLRPTVPVHRRNHSADRRLEHAESLEQHANRYQMIAGDNLREHQRRPTSTCIRSR
jgi:hypothetical protein